LAKYGWEMPARSILRARKASHHGDERNKRPSHVPIWIEAGVDECKPCSELIGFSQCVQPQRLASKIRGRPDTARVQNHVG
jgi:hypothetical protein